MELTEAIYERRAVRDFTDEAVSEAALHGVIDAAVQAPSVRNGQPWSFVVVAGRDALSSLAARAKAHLLTHGLDPDLPATLREQVADPSFGLFHNAPLMIVVCARGGAGAERDCALAAHNLMLAAWDRGLGTCWIGLAEPWLNTAEGKAALDLPEDVSVVAPIIIGHPRTRPPAPPRQRPSVRRIG